MYDNESKNNKKLILMAVDAIKTYMKHIDVPILDTKTSRLESRDPMHNKIQCAYEFIFTAQCSKEEYKYFKDHCRLIEIERYPRLNNEALLTLESPSLDAFSVFEHDEVYVFEYRLMVLTFRDVEVFIYKLKKQTEGLLFDKFSEEFDNEIIEELGE